MTTGYHPFLLVQSWWNLFYITFNFFPYKFCLIKNKCYWMLKPALCPVKIWSVSYICQNHQKKRPKRIRIMSWLLRLNIWVNMAFLQVAEWNRKQKNKPISIRKITLFKCSNLSLTISHDVPLRNHCTKNEIFH